MLLCIFVVAGRRVAVGGSVINLGYATFLYINVAYVGMVTRVIISKGPGITPIVGALTDPTMKYYIEE